MRINLSLKKIFAVLCVLVNAGLSYAQNTPQANPNADQNTLPVIVSGVVPDEATKAKLIARVRELYGARVVDQLAVGNVVAPPNWSNSVHKILTEQLKNVKQGQLQVDGNMVQVRGQIANEALRQQLVSQFATQLTSAYTVKDGLSVQTNEQTNLDRTLANRIIEFDSGSANLRPTSQPILDEMAASIAALGERKVEIVGHTDNQGNPNNNLILSKSRAEAVKQYLIGKNIPAQRLVTVGLGSTQPVASNEDENGRKRNRRIEFRIAN